MALMAKPVKDYRIAVASGPVHVPKTYHAPYVVLDQYNSGTFPFRRVPRIGPPMRAMTVGGSLKWYGGNSYLRRGGAGGVGTWKVYEFNAPTDEFYLTDRGAEVTTGKTLLDGGKTLEWAPSAGGTLEFPPTYSPLSVLSDRIPIRDPLSPVIQC